MKRKIVSSLLALMIVLISIPRYSFADQNGKVIFINMNRTNLASMLHIKSLDEEVQNRGYIGLMNIRGDKGTDDRRSYASMGAGRRANVSTEQNINFQSVDDHSSKLFETSTGQKSKSINDLTINKSINENIANGQYGSTLGSLGQTLSENGLKTAVLGNSDIVENGELIKNRNIGLVAMDQYGRIDSGNIDNINIKDDTMPYGIRTDYNKLIKETKKHYEKNDVLFVDLGDTYRLDNYRLNLNEETYSNMKSKIGKNIDKYLKEVFDMIDEKDTVYISSAFPSDLDYKNKRRLSPIIKFNGEGKGVLSSATTRREGVVANLDVGADILNTFGLKNEAMVGKEYNLISKNDNIKFVSDEYEKIVSVSKIRPNVVNTFVSVVSASWVIAMVILLFKDRVHHKEKVFKILKEFIKLGFILPISFFIAPIFNFKTPETIVIGIVLTTLILYIIGRKLFKNDLKHMGYFAVISVLAIVIDSILGSYLMKNSIMSYDAIIGARYYGMGNEYQGIVIGSSIFGIAVLLHYNKISKWLAAISCFVILITTASPIMGANVGAAISECMAFLLLVLLVFDVKLDFKKIILIGLAGVAIVFAFAAIDIISGSESHLSGFVNQILLDGPNAIIQTFSRKIQMNIKLAQSSAWVNILLAGIAIIAIFIFKPSKHFRNIAKKYPFIFKGFIACIVGCFITLLVNDSGIVAAATTSIYILIPLLIISINMIIFNEKQE
ncbi:hypothetical protein [Romboutsia lituseburensis]|uniref:Uncharacterized protein n=1 Tax=Romboutsia lituseburensis DSM 797 TaxID=1121325 RepID=A0A1G9Q2K8_9FIRM|nr:hypothetical protein [Romboutsia lituseburensis]CEH35317.1 Alkaline phosphatase-like protein [Romboutsia lituseburensis]SDM05264.1 hypothetical protein SAMN04515677_10511 [Romboutsia lituseburensis DSM 797]